MILDDDIGYITRNTTGIERLENSSVLVTGAAGVIGAMLVKTLARVSVQKSLNIKVLALVRDSEKAQRLFSGYDVAVVQGDVCELTDIGASVDYLIHGAAVTKSQTMAAHPVQTLLTSLIGTQRMLELAFKYRVKSMVNLSSMEVYGSIENGGAPVTEDMLGGIDLNNPRSAYPEGKRAAECLCRAFYIEHGVPVKTARLAQCFGAGVPKDESRVFAQFARCVREDKEIALHTDGRSEGNYCYLADAVCGVLTILLNGSDGEVYNVVNETLHKTVRQMAEFVAAEVAKGSVRVVIDIPEDASSYGYAMPVKLRMSAAKLRALGWAPQFDMNDMYRRMMAFWDENELSD